MVSLILFLAATTGIMQLANADVVAGERVCAASPVREFYMRREWRPAWSAGNTAALLRAIDGLADDGLVPARYHRDALNRLPEGAERDVLATDAFLLAGAHLSRGVVDPQFVRPAWCAAPSGLDLAAVLQAGLDAGTLDAGALDTGMIEEMLGRLSPRHEGYTRLRAALAVYRDIARRGGWEVVPSGGALRLGDAGPRVVDLRRRLLGEGYPAAGAEPLFDAPVLDARLESIVQTFQSRHGIAVDGIVGPETLRELNVSADVRAQQIAVNLERWRWMPSDLGASYAIVNIAAFRLDVVERGRRVLSMKTVVGKEYTKTPFFAAQIKEVVVNPWWNVPVSIATKELWPRQGREPSYFASEHIVVTKDGRLRQTPGPWNSLGRIKFSMPNAFDVYLHDTPAKHLFEQPFRAFSHGCIRLERPFELARYLLRDQPRWTPAAIDEAVEAGAELAIPLTTPEPVFVLYWTASVDDDGAVEFHRDHYDRDDALAAALR